MELLNLKETYFPQKISFGAIDNEIFKKIKAQNIEKKTSWIKEQLRVSKSLDRVHSEQEEKKM